MKAEAIIFDLDGTLIDSMYVWDVIGFEYLEKLGIARLPDDFRERLRVMTLMDFANYVRDTFCIDKTAQQITDEIGEMLADQYAEEIPAKEGAAAFLEANKQMKMCVATATDEPLVRAVLRRLGMEEYFDFVITCGQVGKSKTEPDIFLIAAQRLGVAVENAVVVEDSFHAIQTAKAAGFFVVAVEDESSRPFEQKIREISDVYVKTLTDYVVQ